MPSKKKKGSRKNKKSRKRSYKGSHKGSHKGSRRQKLRGCGRLSMGSCNDKFSGGLRACRWSFSKLKCEGIPKKYRKRATLGVGGSATYHKYKAGSRRKLSAARLSPFMGSGGRMKGPYGGIRSPGKKLGSERIAVFETKKEAVKAAQATPTASEVVIGSAAPNAPNMWYFSY